ncbi:hypothetical protein AA313_de0207786 [Arthrobotrys entomopaga]|nr:hypothetical protein AA313_de0207786 [Arthrobotrys entomopaga]
MITISRLGRSLLPKFVSKALEILFSPIPHSGIQRFLHADARMRQFAQNSLENMQPIQEQNCKDGKPRPSLFSKVFEDMNDPTCKHRLTMKQLVDESFVFIIAGTDTTYITITFLTWAIFKDNKVYQRLKAEIETLDITELTNEKLQKLSYLECVIKEGLRLYTAAPLSLPREVPTGGRQLGPHFIPENTHILTPIFTIHRDHTLFPHPFSFKPERWMNATKEMDDAMLTFGGAARPCLGQNLALFEIRLLLATLITSCPDLQLGETCTDNCMEIEERVFIHPKGLKCELQKKADRA